MEVMSKAKQWRSAIYYLALCAVVLSVMFTFIDEKTAKVTFYWAFYFSLAGVLGSVRMFNRQLLWLPGMLLLLGLSKVMWFYLAYTGSADYSPYNDYLNAGKRMLIGGVIGYYLLAHFQTYAQQSLRLIRYGLIAAFVGASLFGFWQYAGAMGRVEFALDRATISAYGYAMLSAALLFMLASESHRVSRLLICLAIFAVSFFIIVQTGTRNMIAAYPLIIMLVGLFHFRHLGAKAMLWVLGAVVLLGALSYKPVIEPRLDATIAEYQLYNNANGNQLGSLTSRLAMWRVGVACLAENPMGMRTEQRTAWFQHYVDTTHKDTTAMVYAPVHLHNELLDSATLQGIPGALVVVLFYIVLLSWALRNKNAPLFGIMLCIIVSGLTDVVFISREMTICIVLIIIMSVMWQRLEAGKKRV